MVIDNAYGIPETKQFPLFDEESVKKAIGFFRYCPDDKKKELAANINEAAKNFNMSFKFKPLHPFLRYASNDLIKGDTPIEEFHIGQLSPITPLTKSTININFGKTKTTLDKIRRIWDNKKTDLDKKSVETSYVIKEAFEKGEHFDSSIILAMEESKNLFDILNPWVYNESDTFKSSSIRNDSMLYNMVLNFPKNGDINNVIYAINNIRNVNILNATIAFINYSDIFTLKEDKNKVNLAVMQRLTTIRSYNRNFDLDIFYNRELGIADSSFGLAAGYKFKEADIEIVNTFIRNASPNLFTRFNKILRNKIKDCDARCTLEPTNSHILSKFTFDNAEYTLYNIYSEKFRMTLHFIKLSNGDIYFANTFYTESSGSYPPMGIFLIKIYSSNIPNLKDDMIAYFYGATVDIKIYTKTIIINNNAQKITESDFHSIIDGINIDKAGNISFLLSYDKSWKEKLNMVKEKINSADSATTEYKNSMCFLFSLIGILYDRYKFDKTNNAMKSSFDVNDALETLDKAIALFKNAITDPKKSFDFKLYYLTTKYYEKINIFSDVSIEDETDRLYWFIMR